MHVKRQRWAAALIGGAVFGCHDASPVLYDDFFTDDASVEGRVTDLAGKALPNIDVSVNVPSTPTYAYQPTHVTTDSLGRFHALAFRVGRIGPPPKPDTVTAQVIAIAIGVQYKTLPGGEFISDSVSVSLQFVPHNTPAHTATVTVRLTGL